MLPWHLLSYFIDCTLQNSISFSQWNDKYEARGDDWTPVLVFNFKIPHYVNISYGDSGNDMGRVDSLEFFILKDG